MRPHHALVTAALAALLAACASTPDYPSEAPERCARFVPLVERVAADERVDPGLIAGITAVESRWRPDAESRAGARGLMQIMPSTGRRLKCGDLLRPEPNLRCGARLLRRLLDRYDGHVDYALAAYAIGAGKVDRAYDRRAEPPRQAFIRRVHAARRAYLDQGCTS